MNRMACRANSFLKLGRVGYSCEHDEIVLHDVGHVFNVLAPRAAQTHDQSFRSRTAGWGQEKGQDGQTSGASPRRPTITSRHLLLVGLRSKRIGLHPTLKMAIALYGLNHQYESHFVRCRILNPTSWSGKQ